MSRITFPIVFSGPTCSGKSTLRDRLIRDYPTCFAPLITHTTRQPREGEQNGVDYHFVDLPTMQQMIGDNQFVEYANVHGNLYGSSRKSIEDILQTGKHCLVILDIQGVIAIREKLADLEPYCIWIQPTPEPVLPMLETRLRVRSNGKDIEEQIQTRLQTVEREMSMYNLHHDMFDFVLLNPDNQLDAAYVDLQNDLFYFID